MVNSVNSGLNDISLYIMPICVKCLRDLIRAEQHRKDCRDRMRILRNSSGNKKSGEH
jgi:hypothetical protein